MNITDKIFSYAYNPQVITPEVAANYKNSLIFIGSQQQIWVPATGAYVGIGMTAYNNILENIQNVNNQITNYDSHLNSYVTTSIYAQLSPDLNISNIDKIANYAYYYDSSDNTTKEYGQGQVTLDTLKTNQNVTLRGINKDTPLRSASGPYNNMKSGINVTVEHAGLWRHGTDPDTGLYFSYFEGNDILSIDDSRTWSYFNSKIDESITTANQFAIDQANNVYKTLLGQTDNNDYISKDINLLYSYANGEIKFIGDSNNGIGEVAYVRYIIDKTNLPIDSLYSFENSTYYDYSQVYVEKDINNVSYLRTTVNSNPVDLYWVNSEGKFVSAVDDNLATNNLATINTELYDGLYNDTVFIAGEKDNHGIVELSNLVKQVILYELDNTGSNSINIIDGINTIKEVAYILDIITDGSNDGAINIAYNTAWNHDRIEDLLTKTQQIADGAVNTVRTSETDNYIQLYNYNDSNPGSPVESRDSRGNVIINAWANVAPTFKDGNNSYVCYTASQFGSNPKYKWIKIPEDSVKYIVGSDVNHNIYGWVNSDVLGANNGLASIIKQYVIDKGGSTTLPLGNYRTIGERDEIVNTNSSVTLTVSNDTLTIKNGQNDLTNTEYFLFNYRQVDLFGGEIVSDSIVKALTDVEWVTAYVANVKNEINQGLGLNDETASWVHGMFASYNAYVNTTTNQFEYNGQGASNYSDKYVNFAYQIGTYLHQEFKTLPQDTVTVSAYTGIRNKRIVTDSREFALQFIQDNNYRVTNTSGTPIDSSFAQHDPGSLIYIDFVGNNTITSVTAGTVLSDSKQYYILDNDYVPVDIHEVENGSLKYADLDTTTYQLKVKTGVTLYYISNINSLSNSDYITSYNFFDSNGVNHHHVMTYITSLANATSANTGLADAYDVRRTIESMFTWINIETGQIIS